MATFRKYQFDVYADFRTINDLESQPRTVVELGHLNPENPINYNVDVLWDDQPAPHWEQYETWPEPVGVHTFLGWDETYTNEYNERLPK